MDSSALVKVVIQEEHSTATRELLLGAECVCSVLVVVEVPRVLRRYGQTDWAQGWQQLRPRLRIVDLTRPLVEQAAALPPPTLRSLDALHVATALSVGRLDGLVAYDRRLLEAAESQGLAVLHPGMAR